MNIYFPHSKQLEYEEYYGAIRASSLFSKHTPIFPYEKISSPVNSKSVIQKADLIIAEVSYPATGLGIELGWAECQGKRIICIYKYDFHVARSLKYISNDFISYDNYPDLIKKLEIFLKKLNLIHI